MNIQTTSLLAVVALLAAPFETRAQLAPYSREELDSLFTFTWQWTPDTSPAAAVGGQLPASSSFENGPKQATASDIPLHKLDLSRLTFVESATRIAATIPPGNSKRAPVILLDDRLVDAFGSSVVGVAPERR